MKTGKTFESFTAEDGRNVILRTPKWEDLDDLMEYFNSLVEERSDEFCSMDEKATRGQLADELGSRLADLEKDYRFSLVAEVDGKAIANSDLERKKGYSSHVGEISELGIRKGYRNIGIGTEMLRTLISQAEIMGVKVLVIRTFSTNKRAIHVYEKTGFKETGRIPNLFHKNGKAIDGITMVKQSTTFT